MNPYKKPDHFTKKAKSEGYAARSVYKLEEIEQRARILPKGGWALDLGCYPGSWSLWLLQKGLDVIGVDFRAPDISHPKGRWIEGSALEVTPESIFEISGGPVDLLVSDMAPPTTGNRFGDHIRQVELATRALAFCGPLLKPGGNFVAKVFEGQDAAAYVKEVNAMFQLTRRIKPEATRDRSVEFFVIGLGKRA